MSNQTDTDRIEAIIYELINLLHMDGWTDEDLFKLLTGLESELGDLSADEIYLLFGEFPPAEKKA